MLRKVRLTASEGTWLTGESVIDLATGAVTMGRKADAMGAAVEGAAYNSAEVSLGDGVTLESRGSATVYMVVNAADLTDGMAKVEVVTDRGGKEFSVGGKLLEPGKQYTKTLSVNALTEYKSVTVGFEDVAAKYLAGPTSYGGNLYSAYTGDSYRTGSGEFLAAASVAGTAALIKSYFPKLTGSQIRDILLRSVTSRRGAEVEKGIRVDDNATQDLFLFEDLCASGGILNAYQAIVEAEKTAKK